MDILFLSFICSLSYVIILCKAMGISNVVRMQVPLDILFTFGLPVLFIGTFSGMATAFISGVMFSLITFFLSVLVPKPKPLFKFGLPYAKAQNSKDNVCSAHPTRS
jgi:hypothetical protein